MSETFSYDSLHFYNYLSGGVSDSPSLWQSSTEYNETRLFKLQNRKNKNWKDRKYFHASLSALCEKYLGCSLSSIEYPGGRQRSSYRLILENGESIIASRREDLGRSKLEERILHYLGKNQSPVPKTLAFNGLVLFQEDLGNRRLSNALENADTTEYEKLLDKALQSLLQIHNAAKAENLGQRVPILGCEHDWLIAFMDRPALLGNYLEIPAPVPDLDNIYDLLLLVNPQFIKWDARLGNAMLTDQGEIVWIDWEHCGARNRLDDLLWLMCDESTPFHPHIEDKLLNKNIINFKDDFTIKAAHSYCRVFGMLHCCTRLTLILSEKEDYDWGDPQRILEGDKVGVTLKQAQHLCQRAAYWSKKEPMIANLSDWFLEISERLSMLQ